MSSESSVLGLLGTLIERWRKEEETVHRPDDPLAMQWWAGATRRRKELEAALATLPQSDLLTQFLALDHPSANEIAVRVKVSNDPDFDLTYYVRRIDVIHLLNSALPPAPPQALTSLESKATATRKDAGPEAFEPSLSGRPSTPIPAPPQEQELRERVRELEALVYIGDHHFPDLTWKARCADFAAALRIAEARLAASPPAQAQE